MCTHLKVVVSVSRVHNIIPLSIGICLLASAIYANENMGKYDSKVIRNGLDAANRIVEKELKTRDLGGEWRLRKIHFNVKHLDQVSQGYVRVVDGRVASTDYISPDSLEGSEFKFIGGVANEVQGDVKEMVSMIKALLEIDTKKYDDCEITSIFAYVKKEGKYYTARLSFGKKGEVSGFRLISQSHGKILSMQERYSDYAVFCIQNADSAPANLERPKNHQAALLWSKEKADNGNLEAMVYLGACYYDGNGIPNDKKEAGRWYRQAMDGGNKTAMGLLGINLLANSESSKNVNWFFESSVFSNTVFNIPIEVSIEITADGMVLAEGMCFSEKGGTLQELSVQLRGLEEIGRSQDIKTIANIFPHEHAPHVQIANVLDICTSVEGISVNLLCRKAPPARTDVEPEIVELSIR